MPLFTPSFLDTLRESLGETADLRTWPGVLADPEQETLRTRIEAAVEAVHENARPRIASLLTSTTVRDLFLGRALLWGLELACAGGAVPEAISLGGAVRMTSAEGARFYLVPLLFHTGEHRAGHPEDVSRLVRTLEAAFGSQYFAVSVRRPLARHFDAEPVSRAVQLWLHAVKKGEWKGRQAVYEDEKVAIELTLVDCDLADDRSRMLFLVEPPVALDRLAVVDAHLQSLARNHKEQQDDGPFVAMLVAHPTWGLSRGFMGQLLYGTADRTTTTRDGEALAHEARYEGERYSLFADRTFEDVAAIWWLESHHVDPMRFDAWSHENPWCGKAESVPSLPGPRYRPVGHDPVVMTWEGPLPKRRRPGDVPSPDAP